MRAVPFYSSVFESEKSVVSAHSNVVSGMNFCAALADDNVARQYKFSAELLYAAAF